MEKATFNRICDLIYGESGIRIKPGKEAMVSARLGKRLRAIGLQSETEYLEYLEQDLEREMVNLLDLISTNVTHFFRESEHFDFLAERFSEWIEAGQHRFRFWCAASSTGEEPYSIVMTLDDVAKRSGKRLDWRLLATDISTRVLAHAKAGEYSQDSLETVPTDFRTRYLQRVPGADKPTWKVSKDLQQAVLFRRLNLSTPPFPMKGPMDVVFCRNVMFYFDDPVKEALIQDVHRMLKPGGYLIIGKSESIPSVRGRFERIGPSIFQKLG